MIADFEDFVTWMFVIIDDLWQKIARSRDTINFMATSILGAFALHKLGKDVLDIRKVRCANAGIDTDEEGVIGDNVRVG